MFHFENMPSGPSSTIPNQIRHPFLHRNENLRQSFDNQSLSERVHLVLKSLDFMKSVNINTVTPCENDLVFCINDFLE